MNADALLQELLQAGIEPGLTPDGEHLVFPAGRLTQAQRQAILQFKRELIERLQESARLTTELLAAAMRAAAHHGDDAAAREQWQQDVLATPPELRQDLLTHLNKEYPK